MKYIGIFILICAMISIAKAQSWCDPSMCNKICSASNMNGKCKGNECDCSSGKSCSTKNQIECEIFCHIYKLKGECDENQCICKAELKPCLPIKCTEQCIRDAPPECRFCIVTPLVCMEYGPIQTCGCLCTCPWANTNRQFNEINNFLPIKNKSFSYKTMEIMDIN